MKHCALILLLGLNLAVAEELRTIQLTLPAPVPEQVSWEAIPLPNNPDQDVWAPHETTPTIKVSLPMGGWVVRAHGPFESEYEATLMITPTLEDNLTIMIPFNNTMGGEGVETAENFVTASEQFIKQLKSAFISLQTQQMNGDGIYETQQDITQFIKNAKGQLGESDYREIKKLLELMGPRFAKSQRQWDAAKGDLIRIAAEAGTGEDVAFVCETAPSCLYEDKATNLRLQVPQGWALSYPYFYENAAGGIADKATISFIRKSDGVVVNLNQPRSTGECQETRSGYLCYFFEDKDYIDKKTLDIIIKGAN